MTGQGGGPAGGPRDALLVRWLHLTRRVLPGMVRDDWPVRLDHCFMRICLDAAVGSPWHDVIPRPATRHATVDQLCRAIAVAERIAADPSVLAGLNRCSLDGRRRTRSAA